ncbi:DUF1177 domain-containing protein [Occultella kanbiaonis]|uniref:DUF1177 domain-containing protein n=1 Tax=Occultella kanbiaonis TaxID=2675754 RepID=UPI0012BA1B14|nr:DUF1177 domain-containing protein [Occultella kanbiaonis]
MLKHVLTILDLLDDPRVDGERVAAHLRDLAGDVVEAIGIDVTRVQGDKGHTDFVTVRVPGTDGRSSGGDARTLGVIGRLGGIGARPERIGYVSDGDGATAALATAAKVVEMYARGDRLPGDVIIGTHVCAWAPTRPHEPVPFMDSPVDMGVMNDNEVLPEMDAIVSIDTTKGNRVINHRGIAISPTVRQGYILPVSPDLVSVYESVCGEPAQVFPLSTQDITPYANGLYHINSILQPAVAAQVPVVGVALTAVTAVAGSATGASHEVDIALAARYALEVAKGFGDGSLSFCDEQEFATLTRLYGDATHLQGVGTD